MVDKEVLADNQKVPTGNYEMVCSRVENRKSVGRKDKTKVYDFKDYYFEIIIPGKPSSELKLGFFREVKAGSELVKFLAKLGVTANVGESLDLDAALGKKIKADVVNNTNEFGKTFSEISVNSIVLIS